MDYLDVAELTDQLETEEVSKYLGYVIDDGGNAEQGGRATVVLKVPEQKGEDQPNTEAHEPSNEEEGRALEVFKLLQYGHPFRDLSHRLGKHFCLKG